MNTTGTKKRTYDEQFKRDAVALLEGGRKAAQLARELGISHWNLRDWKERYGTGAAAVSQPQARSAGLVNAGGSSAVGRRGGDRIPSPRTRRHPCSERHFKKALAIVAQPEGTVSSSSKPSTTNNRV
ncbi:MAG: transposase [Verrucomicrobiaceae bacterium]|nr:transposase [Verrucomicrobiaceae bacterium]